MQYGCKTWTPTKAMKKSLHGCNTIMLGMVMQNDG